MLQTITTRIAMVLLVFAAGPALAENAQKFDDYTIHYNAFPSDVLQAKVAKLYKITRSKNRAILTISVVKKDVNPAGVPVKAEVRAKATNLTGQLKNISLKEVTDDSSVYYISQFHVADKEVMDFTIQVKPEGKGPYTVKFRQQFFTQ